jgi:hypothetical protein
VTSTSSTTATFPTSTSTTLPCSDAACILADAPACADEQIPLPITHRLDRAFAILADVRASDDGAPRRRYQRIGRLLKQAAKRATRAAALKKPRLTAECAAELRAAIEAVAADTAAECVGRGFCRGS